MLSGHQACIRDWKSKESVDEPSRGGSMHTMRHRLVGCCRFRILNARSAMVRWRNSENMTAGLRDVWSKSLWPSSPSFNRW